MHFEEGRASDLMVSSFALATSGPRENVLHHGARQHQCARMLCPAVGAKETLLNQCASHRGIE